MNFIFYLYVFYLGIGPVVLPEPSISLLSDSWVSIEGSSNFDDFSLHYVFEEYAEQLDLAVSSTSQQQLIIHPYELHLPISEFKCRNVFLRNDFRETLKYREQPEILINIDSMQIKEMDSEQSGSIQTLVKIGGVQRLENISYHILDNNDGVLNMKGNIKIDMTDYQLEIERKFLGFIQVEPEVEISFLFNFVINQ